MRAKIACLIFLLTHFSAYACQNVFLALDAYGNTAPRTLYPLIKEPNKSGHLPVSDVHSIYWEESGNPDGIPVIFLHGGPGAGTNASQRRFFDPAKYRIILMDQRGAGKSTPSGEVTDNTTAALVSDIEKLREKLGIGRWHVFGGSFGAMLAVAYAEAHPAQVRSLTLRGVFLGRPEEVNWLYSMDGAGKAVPDGFTKLQSAAGSPDILVQLHKNLQSSNPETRYGAILALNRWENRLANSSLPNPPPERDLYSEAELKKMEPAAKIELHYFTNGNFLTPNQLLANADKLKGIPGVVIQGDGDLVTPPKSAQDLQKAWPGVKVLSIPGAGHTASDPRLIDALVRATDDLVDLP